MKFLLALLSYKIIMKFLKILLFFGAIGFVCHYFFG